MANKLANRVKMSVASIASAGVGNLTLGSALAGFMTFAQGGIVNGDTVPYAIEEGVKWEIGTGTYTASGTIMSRSVTGSFDGTTLGTSPVAFTSNCIVMITPLAADLALTGLSGTLPVGSGGTGLTSLTAGYIPYGNGAGAFSSSSGLYFDGTNLAIGATATYTAPLIVTGTTTTGIVIKSSSGAASGLKLFNDSVTDSAYVYNHYSGPLLLGTANTERMRITSGGLVGIGTTAPSYILDVYTGAAGVLQRWNTGAVSMLVEADHTGNGNWYLSPQGSQTFNIKTGGSTRLTLDGSGNLGLGVTPSAWGSYYRAIQIGEYAAFAHKVQNATAIVASNAYASNNTDWNYTYSSVAATRYETGTGEHRWFTAPSGTAGNAISFTQAMTLDSSGSLLVKTTSAIISGTSVSVAGNNGTAAGIFSFGNTNSPTKKWQIGPDANGAYINYNDAGTGMYMSYGGTSWTASSDERLKDIIEPIRDGIIKVSQLRSVIGKFKTDPEGTRRSFLIAQDVQKVLPEAVEASNAERLGVQYTDVIPLLVSAIKELAAKVNALEAANG